MPDDLVEAPLEVTTYKNAVVVTGPGNVGVAMTADAAERSAERLLDAAKLARIADDNG
jgi:hypothetical protein